MYFDEKYWKNTCNTLKGTVLKKFEIIHKRTTPETLIEQ